MKSKCLRLLKITLYLLWVIFPLFSFAQDNPHGAIEMECKVCHTTESWNQLRPDVQFDHNTTSFPLLGRHKEVECRLCHSTLLFRQTYSECFECHLDIHDNQFGNYCENCHSFERWIDISFFIQKHNETRFPLAGVHTSLDCQVCHINGQYIDLPVECYGCHQKDYNKTTDPDHVSMVFGTDCIICHSISRPTWRPADFQHFEFFPLIGAHQNLPCNNCHSAGYSGTPTDCYSCHVDDYEGTENPNHTNAGFEHDCSLCHSVNGWLPVNWSHDDTGWSLTGAHISIDCSLCHLNQQYIDTPSDCYSCHVNDYEGVDNPNHTNAGFDHDCTLCHSIIGWLPANWSHDDTGWPLTGAHVNIACGLCHLNQQYVDTPSDCFFCHETDYNGTTEPNHSAAGFPRECETCHTTIAWEPADFNHLQWFPIYTGRHRNEWDLCSDCHTNSSDYSVFTCISCHEHNRADMDDEHDDVAGYVYESTACYECHPTGVADDDRLLIPVDKQNSRKQIK